MKHWEESWKYDAQRSIFDELRGVSSGDGMLDITSETKMILEGEIKEAKMRIAVAIPVLYELSFSLRVCEGFSFSGSLR